MTTSAAMFVSENNRLSAFLRSRIGHIVVPSARDPKDRERLILTQDETREHLEILARKGTISPTTADEVNRQVKMAGVRATMSGIVRQIDAFQAHSPPKDVVLVDVCSDCGAHANLIFENVVMMVGSIEMTLRTFWYQVQHGQMDARTAAVTLQKLYRRGPRLAIRTADMPIHVEMMLRVLTQGNGLLISMLMADDPFNNVMDDDDALFDSGGQMIFTTSRGYMIGR